ncbi:MAG TPA: fibronectin type III domain-containing protein, partial [Chitinophagaceae bacterium]|nr:fibronectin type III domain-containing protein [Chitinophagaceae bacterium]
MTTQKKILISLLVCTISVIQTKAQNVVAVSSNPGPGLHIALNWAPYSGAVKYNIFRKKSTDASYPGTALNGVTPIQTFTNCAKIKSILIKPPADSTEWKIVANTFATGSTLFNPCNINTLKTDTTKYKKLQALCKASMPIAVVTGLGYRDSTILNGTAYKYKIVALNASNTVLGNVVLDLTITAGAFVLPAAPTGVIAEPGDALIQVRWNNVTGAAGFIVERGPAIVGPFTRVNESVFSTKVRNHLNGDTLIPDQNGMIDFKRFTVINGKDSTHLVNGFAVDGPKNNSNYYYRVSAIDIFRRPGSPSSVFGPVIPRDSTAPSAVIDITTTADDATGNVTIHWAQVVKDKNGHWEYPDSTVKYKMYRFPSSENPDSVPAIYLGQTATIGGLKFRDTVDSDPGLRSTFGNKTWWYRFKSFDQNGNTSQWSSATSVIVKDITPPSIVKNLVTKGFEDRISVKWQRNPEPDIASYMVYRSLCHLGSWIDCSKQKDTCRTWQTYDPTKFFENKDGTQIPGNKEAQSAALATGVTGTKLPCPCSGPFVFLGEITKDSVDRAVSRSNFFFDDKTIPPGSPLCYAYWVKAKDSSGNLSGSFPIPSPAEQLEIKCDRLRDRTPPENAIISGLFAQAEQIRVEWIGPPTQDTRAYHVYRAEGTNPAVEPASGAYAWVGGMTVELPPTMPVVLTSPYTPPGLATCDKISVMATPWMSQGFFEDKHIEPKLTYWYKVVGIDYDGNETPLDRAAAISTFSFSRKAPDAPTITGIGAQADPCAVIVKWSPSYDASKHIGFIVYRSSSSAGPFIPVVVNPVAGSDYTDTNVVKGQTYWYSVAVLMKNGRLSPLSTAKSIT